MERGVAESRGRNGTHRSRPTKRYSQLCHGGTENPWNSKQFHVQGEDCRNADAWAEETKTEKAATANVRRPEIGGDFLGFPGFQLSDHFDSEFRLSDRLVLQSLLVLATDKPPLTQG